MCLDVAVTAVYEAKSQGVAKICLSGHAYGPSVAYLTFLNRYLCFLKTQLHLYASDNEIIEPSNYCTTQIQYLALHSS